MKVVLVAQNVEAVWYEEAVRRTPCPGLITRWLKRIEGRAVAWADLVVTLTEQDRQALARIYGVPAHKMVAIPPGFDPFPSPSEPDARSDRTGRIRAAFVGSRFSGNVTAARDVIGLADSCRSFADFVIVGTVGEALRDLALPPNVTRLGYVEQLATVLQGCDVLLNPSAMRTGINMKVLTAVACGRRVLSTPEGARGFEPLIGGAIQVAPVQEFAARLQHLRPLAAADWERVRAYEWPRIAGRRLAAYGALLERQG